MSDSVADNPLLRNFRNFSSMALIAIFLLAICYYISGFLLLFSTSKDLKTIDAFFSKDIVNQFIAIHKNMVYYWKFYFEKRDILTLKSGNGFILKLWLATLIPYLILLSIAWIFRAPIMDWRPFKKPESIHGDAHWANDTEIKKMGLRSKTGVLLGKFHNEHLIAEG